MYARIASATGWTWEYIGQCLTLPRVYALFEYWKQCPPVNETVAAYIGYKPAAAKAPLRMLDNAAVVADMTTDPRTLKWVTDPRQWQM